VSKSRLLGHSAGLKFLIGRVDTVDRQISDLGAVGEAVATSQE
jgi:hypothetical protein